MRQIKLRDIYLARQAIRGYARHTPLNRSASLSSLTGGEVYLKLETLQEGARGHCLFDRQSWPGTGVGRQLGVP